MLLLDASAPVLHAGVIADGNWVCLEKERGDVITTLPAMVKKALQESGIPLTQIKSFVHCEGPGSLLGLRLCAMMMETWRAMPGTENARLFVYRSLQIAAAILTEKGAGKFSVVTQFRRGGFCLCASDGTEREIVGEDGFDAENGDIFAILQKNQHLLPPEMKIFDYDLAPLPGIMAGTPELFRPSERAEAYSPKLSDYKLWDGKRHTAPKSGRLRAQTPRND